MKVLGEVLNYHLLGDTLREFIESYRESASTHVLVGHEPYNRSHLNIATGPAGTMVTIALYSGLVTTYIYVDVTQPAEIPA